MHVKETFWWKAKALAVGGMTTGMWKCIMLPLVVLIEHSTQVSEVFQNFITF